jgi:hypothetical protein
MKQRFRNILIDIEIHRQQFKQQLQETNTKNQILSVNLQQTQNALIAIRRIFDIAPDSEIAATFINDSNSGVRPAPNDVKRDRISEE